MMVMCCVCGCVGVGMYVCRCGCCVCEIRVFCMCTAIGRGSPYCVHSLNCVPVLMANILESEVKQESAIPEVDVDRTSREYTMLDKKVRSALCQ